MDLEWEHHVRQRVFQWLSDLEAEHPDALPARKLQIGLDVGGHRIGVMAYGAGIWKPASLVGALSVMTTAPAPGQPPPYEDRWIDESRLSYAYQGSDSDNAWNRSMRIAYEHQLPLIYLYGVRPGWYLAEFPVFVTRDAPSELRVDLLIGAGSGEPGVTVEIDGRNYSTRMVKTRLHQDGFRARVLAAYNERCAVCSLRHRLFLDAAHIVPDSEPNGLAITANGMSLCKIHHTAYDGFFIGIRPDLVVEVNEDLLNERDGPMLQHGLKDFHGQRLRVVPGGKHTKPDRERLEWRYERFAARR